MLDRLLMSAIVIFQPNLHAGYQIQESHAAYSQDDLSKLFEEANKKAEKNPLLAVPDYRKIIAERSPFKEAAIEKVGSIYELLINKNDPSPKTMRDALNFYEDIVQNHTSSHYLAKAYLLSGTLMWHLEVAADTDNNLERLQNILDRSEARLQKACKIGNKEIQSEAAWNLGLIFRNSAPEFYNDVDKWKAMIAASKRYFEDVVRLDPNSSRAKDAKRFIIYNH